ncbi:response regulator transcription factor [Anaeromicropila herbilytica]|uniref:Stage 0 sporulation protein A homolog n=1 Tax=Anaeromicropila herbilytica TaxID=2785025 RepID=A0A7R7EMY3_9FIRM|nr:response regulator transcription factor [Anaeromicropila herbilytica]BCN31779.1 DNA-binding response regulator [Anaeromicropila herbilytica]
MGQKILIIEDEKELANILGAYLEVEQFEPIVRNDGKEGLKTFKEEEPSLVLLDIMLPIIDGIQVCKEIRQYSDVPIIMISAKSGEMDKVIALGIGADDYVTKPFSPLELVARVKAQLRRYEKSTTTSNMKKEEITVGELYLNKSSYSATIKGEILTLTTKEFELLYFLAKNPNQVFSKEQIYNSVWGYSGYCDDNSITVYINRLREKLGKYKIDYIKTVWGAGYKFSEQ